MNRDAILPGWLGFLGAASLALGLWAGSAVAEEPEKLSVEDVQLEWKINRVLAGNEGLPDHLIVARADADDGVVTLYGAVEAEDKKFRAEKLAYGISEVKRVVNFIEVKDTAALPDPLARDVSSAPTD